MVLRLHLKPVLKRNVQEDEQTRRLQRQASEHVDAYQTAVAQPELDDQIWCT